MVLPVAKSAGYVVLPAVFLCRYMALPFILIQNGGKSLKFYDYKLKLLIVTPTM